MSKEEQKRLDLQEVNRAQNIILQSLELNSVNNANSFGALSLLAITVAQDGEMDKFEFLKIMSVWWDSIEKYTKEKGPSLDDPEGG